MGGENIQKPVKKQAIFIEQQAETIRLLEARIGGLETQVTDLKTIIAHMRKDSG